MSEQLQTRLREIARECGGNRALCEKSGISERTFANWLAGASEPKVIGIAAIAQAAGVTIDWIVNGTKPKERLGSHAHEGASTIQVPLIERQLDRQDADLLERLRIADHMPFSRAFLERRLDLPETDYLCVFSISGDSMHPTMDSGDLVLVDRNQQLVDDGIYAFIFKEKIHIKRIVNVAEGLEVVSDNKSLYPPYGINGDDLTLMAVIGRVIWVGKMLP